MRANNRKIRSLVKIGQQLFNEVLRDGVVTDRESFEMLSYADSLHQMIQDAITNKNPQQCYMAYTTAKVMVDGLSGQKLKKQAEKDGYDPDMVLFLADNVVADDSVKSNPRGGGRNLGYGTTNGGMAKNQLRSIKRISVELHDALLNADELPDWVLSKITVAQDRLSTATDYILSKLRELELKEMGHKMNPYED